MRTKVILATALAAAFLATQVTSESVAFQAVAVRATGVNNLPPTADAGPDFITYVGLPTEFGGSGTAPDAEIARYEWDFDGDGTYDFQSMETGVAVFVFSSTGVYDAVLRVYDAQGNVATDSAKAIVKAGTGNQQYLPSVGVKPVQRPTIGAPRDGVPRRYAVMINGGSETRFWEDVTFMYSTLINDFDLPPERIYLFNYNGADPYGGNPDNMIDYPATLSDIDAIFTQLSTVVDGDDELFVWVTDHGYGYIGNPQHLAYGYLAGFASVDPGDEQDYIESDFKLRSLCTYGQYADPTYNHGMNQLRVTFRYYANGTEMWRNEFVSTFANLYFERLGVQSDADFYIERLVDYLLGDFDRDGIVETTQGEVFDYDGDGIPPYDYATGVYDEDDWGGWDFYDDNFNNINSLVPGTSYRYTIFDYNFDGHVDIDIDPDPNNLEVDGTDLDNQGLFDGIDVNQDGDMDDWISIDERIYLPGGPMLDDELSIFLDRIDTNVISTFMEQCFSGGFIDDLSASNRVISTATEEEAESYGNLFVELFTSALHRATRYGYPVNADFDHNGHISMREAFVYAAENDFYSETPQYDDNGDGIGHPLPIPQGGDGSLGSRTYLERFHDLALSPETETQSGSPGQTVQYTLQVTNTGNINDTFEVTISGYSWPTSSPLTVGPLAAGAGASLPVFVSIPADALDGATDTAQIMVISQGDNTQQATATLITEARTPLAVELAHFAAISVSGHVVVTWETVSEIDNQGFNVYRSTQLTAPETLLAFVPSLAPGGNQGFAYEWHDTNFSADQTGYYWLEDVNLSGGTTLHGPVRVTVNQWTSMVPLAHARSMRVA